MSGTIMPSFPLFTLLFPVPHIVKTIYLLTCVESTPLSAALVGYAAFSIFASILGLAGLRMRSPTLLFTFSNHLFLDVFLSLFPKLTLLLLFRNFAATPDLCPTIYDGANSYTQFRVPRLEIATGIIGKLFGVDERVSWCGVGLLAAQAAFMAVIVMGAVVQWRAAMGVRRMAIWYELSQKTIEAREAADCSEKESLLEGLKEK